MARVVTINTNRKRIVWIILFLVLLVVVYAGSYLPRRAAGSYRMTQTGELRLNGVSALSDLEQWSPDGCWWQPGFKGISGKHSLRSNNLGKFYAPLITLDRKFNFPDRPVDFAGEFMKARRFESLIK